MIKKMESHYVIVSCITKIFSIENQISVSTCFKLKIYESLSKRIRQERNEKSDEVIMKKKTIMSSL